MSALRFIRNFCVFTLVVALFPTSVFPGNPTLKSALADASYSDQAGNVDKRFSTLYTTQPTAQTGTPGPLFVDPDNRRYFTDGTKVNGKYKVVYLAGAHTWCDLSDCDDKNPVEAIFDYGKYLDFVENHGYNFFKLWRSETSGGGENGPNFWFSPMPYERSQSECCAYDGGNKFDLTKFNQAYFDRMRARLIEARDRGFYVSVMLFDGWSVDSKYGAHVPWLGHPYNLVNNVNHIDGDLNDNGNGEETHILLGTDVTALQEAYVRKVIDTVNDLDNVLYEISNESPGDNPATPQFDGSRDWQYHMINFVRQYEAGKPKQHPIGMTWEWLNGNNQVLYDSPADWISLGGNLDLNVYSPPVTTGALNSKIILADTDHLCGICGSRQWVWKSFTRGENPIFMDIYDPATSGRGLPFNNPNEVEIRQNITYVKRFADRINLSDMVPTSSTSFCSSGYCLRNAVASGAEYLAYLPSGGSITIDLSATPGTLTVEWFNPSNGATTGGGTVTGGAKRQLTAPFGGDAVLYLYNGSAPLSRDTTGVFRPTNGLLYLKNSNSTGFADLALNYGLPGDYPVVGDWDGNGTVTIGIYRNGYFYLKNANTLGFADIVFPFGQPGDQPIAGDWDGDGIDTIGVYRPSVGQFLLRNSNSAGTPAVSFYLGNAGDVGVAGDWNGDGTDTTGVFRPSNGVIFLKSKNETGIADIALNYGLPGDRPVMGDWNDDGIDTIGIYRNGSFYLRNENTNGFAELIFGLGNPGDMPIAGNWDALP